MDNQRKHRTQTVALPMSAPRDALLPATVGMAAIAAIAVAAANLLPLVVSA